MSTKRTPITRGLKAQITPTAVRSYRRLRAQDGRCTCPRVAPYPGQVYDSSNPAHREREREYRRERDAYELARASCIACAAITREHAFLVEELRLPLKPWQAGLDDFPAVVAALEAAARPARTRTRKAREILQL
jgi:hypothetical protein